MKQDALDDIVDQVVERLVARVMMDDNPITLEPAEFEVVLALGLGKSNQDIADEIHKSAGVVANKVLRLTTKTGMNRTRLSLYGCLLGLSMRGRGDVDRERQKTVIAGLSADLAALRQQLDALSTEGSHGTDTDRDSLQPAV